jgi:hypothetical protein
MKKVFLSLAVIATLTVVSCKQADANAEETAVDTTVVEEVAAPVMDTTVVDTTMAAPTTEEAAAPAAH